MDYFQFIITAILGSGGVLGLCMFLIKLWLEKKLKNAEEEAKKHKIQQQKRYAVNDEYAHAIGRFLFWTAYGAKRLEEETGKSYWNGELQNAYEAVQEAEEKKKELDRSQLASVNEE